MNRYRKTTLVLEVSLLAVALLYLLPLYGLINVALKAPNNYSPAFALSGEYTFANFAKAWNEANLGPALANSAVIAIGSVLGIVVVGALASYPLARVGRGWARVVFYVFLAGLVIPGQLGLLPLFKDMLGLGLVGSLAGVVLILIGGAMPFTIFIFTTFLREIPKEYEEAAVVDGAGPLQTFWYVLLPMMRPAVGTVAILNGIAVWNNFFIVLLYLSGSGVETAPVRINRFVGQYSSDWPVIFAALAITSVPVLAVYFALQKSVIEGFSGGIKG